MFKSFANLKNLRVSSAAIRSAELIADLVRSDASATSPIGVPTKTKMPLMG